MQILARAVGRRKEAVAQVQIIKGSGQFIINSKPAQQYLQNNSCSLISVKSPFLLCQLLEANGVNPFSLNKGDGLDTLETATPSLVESNNLSPTTFLATKEALPSLGVPHQGDGRRDAQRNVLFSFDQVDTIVKVKGGGLIGQADAIKLAVARAICSITDLKFIQNTNAFSKSENSVVGKRDEAQSLAGLEKPEANRLSNIPHTLEIGESSLLESVQSEQNFQVSSQIPAGDRETNNLENIFKKQLKTKGYLTQDSRVKERRKYGLKKARKASQYHKR